MTARGLPCVCILAGGRGTRLGGLVTQTPKPLLPVAGRPFLAHQLRLLSEYGARRAVLCVGYLGEKIREVLGDSCSGIELAYSFDGPRPAGTLGAIQRARPLLDDRFLVLYGDTYLRIDYTAFASAWAASGRPGAMSVLHNAGRFERSNAVFRCGEVVRYDKYSPTADMEWIDYGVGGLTGGALAAVPDKEADLAVLYGVLAEQKQLFGYEATERFYDIGTPDALAETERFLRSRSGG
jgi:NDP-sugar pyrophosphorylase family protein